MKFLYKLYLLFSHFSSKLNKKFFIPLIFSTTTKHYERKLNLFYPLTFYPLIFLSPNKTDPKRPSSIEKSECLTPYSTYYFSFLF